MSGSPVFGDSVRIDPLRLARDLAASDVFGKEAVPRWVRVVSRARSGRSSGSAADVNVTTTLGRLYLDQGHLDEAERIFRQVLEAHPGNQAAVESLEAVERARRSLEEAEGATRPPVALSRRTRRKVARLERFLRRVSRPLSGAV